MLNCTMDGMDPGMRADMNIFQNTFKRLNMKCYKPQYEYACLLFTHAYITVRKKCFETILPYFIL